MQLVPDQRLQAGLGRPRARRVFSHPIILLACLIGSIALIRFCDVFLSDAWGEILNDRGRSTYPLTVQNIMWVVFGLGIGELIVRTRDAFAEHAELGKGYLPEDETTILQAPDLRRIYAVARSAVQDGAASQGRFLPRLIQRVVTQVQTSQAVDQANALLNSSLELALHEIDLRYSMIRYVIWAIPTLGFIGTVMGIALALQFAGSVDLQDPSLLAQLSKHLAVAFNTTLLALVMSAVLVLVQHIIQAYEERALNRAGVYCLDNLINRLYVD
ncbi:MAG TPA: MotA/TolQ/ExbB proton channel family protein [Geminicoccaceae bacterium]|nr:MotA/TolQ/ExbB proton channel family protein [Geminicoccaceae bacterium]